MCNLSYVIVLFKIINLLVDNNTTLEYRFNIIELYFIIYMFICVLISVLIKTMTYLTRYKFIIQKFN